MQFKIMTARVDRSRSARHRFLAVFGGLIDVQEKGATDLMTIQQIHYSADTVIARLAG
jgi:hypothetical protein